jgi:hypothetical protein
MEKRLARSFLAAETSQIAFYGFKLQFLSLG